MNERVAPAAAEPAPVVTAPPPPGGGLGLRLLWFVLPFVALGLAALWLFTGDLLRPFDNGAPPVEAVTFERTVLDQSGISILVRVGGSQPLSIAQVAVDDAYWTFTQDPPGQLPNLGSAWLRIPYPWVTGEAHAVKLVTSTGATFEHVIAVAVETPKGGGLLLPQAILGLFVGFVPVAIGLLFYPALRSLPRGGMDFILALTVGLLGFLLVDTLIEAFELSAEAAPAFQGGGMVILAAAAAFLILFAVGRRRGVPEGAALAFYIALGIGLHNLGEGLAIGAAFAAGAAGLGTFLVLGFTLHNVTEGIGIAAPLVDRRPPLSTFAGLALLAGGPAIVGLWVGGLSTAPQWTALALSIGAGAILQVIIEVGSYLIRRARRSGAAWLNPSTLSGLIVGGAVMYATALLVKI